MYIVTGGAGFIGSAIVWALNGMSVDNILIVDHLGKDTHKWKNLRGLRYIDYMEKDIFRSYLEDNKFANIDTIIHMGACSSTTEQNASYLAENNFSYTKELAMYAVKNEIRFIYASSAATYGDGSNGYEDDENKLDSLRPLNMYGYSKHMFDLWARNNGLLNMITGLKFTNVFGPNEYHKGEMRSMVCKAYKQIKDTGKVRLFKSHRPEFTDGEQKRDFIYIKDAVAMVTFFIETYEYGIFNVGRGEAFSWNSLVQPIFKALGKPVNIEYIDMPVNLRSQYQYYTCSPIDKIRKIGFRRKLMPLEDAVRDYVVNYLEKDRYLAD